MTHARFRAARRQWQRVGLLSALYGLSAAPSIAVEPVGMSASQIIARNLTARGGEAAWRKVEGIEFVGKMDAARPRPQLGGTIDAPPASPASRRKTLPGAAAAAAPKSAGSEAVQVPYRLELKRPHKSRLEIDVQGLTAVQVFNGKDGWKLRPFLGQSSPQPFSAEESKLASNEPHLDGLLINAAAEGTQVSVEGADTLDGRKNYRLKLQTRSGDIRHVWVDSGTFLETRIDGVRKFDGKSRTMYTYFRNYRLIDGLSVPCLLETAIDGQRTMDKVVIDKVVINPELPDSRFDKPPAANTKSTAALVRKP